MISIWGKILQLLPELIGTLSVGVTKDMIKEYIERHGITNHTTIISISIAVMIAISIILVSELLVNKVVPSIPFVRRIIYPFSKYEGKWVSNVDLKNRNIAIVDFKYDTNVHCFRYSGTSYNNEGTLTAKWRSESVQIINEFTFKYFANGYLINGSQLEAKESAGYIIFDNDVRGFGYTTDLGQVGSVSYMTKMTTDIIEKCISKPQIDNDTDLKIFIKSYLKYNNSFNITQQNIMMEIYREHISIFENMSKHEDYNNNLLNFLIKNFDWKDKVICDAGVGLGRNFNVYLKDAKKVYATDLSETMINECKNRNNSNKIDYFCIDNMNLHELSDKIKADTIISSYSFGHTVINSGLKVEEIYNILLDNCIQLCNDDGQIIIIENLSLMGERLSYDYKLEEYFNLLSEEFYFQEIDTDYRFDTIEEAIGIMTLFFGDEVGNKIIQSEKTIIPEKTGVWYQTKENLLINRVSP